MHYRRHNNISGLALSILCSVILALYSLPAATAEKWTNPRALGQAVQKFLEKELQKEPSAANQRTEIKVGTVDARLRLHRCTQPLSFKLHNNRRVGRTTVKVACRDNKPWSIFVPATVRVYQPVVVAAAPISRGSQVARSQLKLEEQEVSRLHYGYFARFQDVVGQVARRTINTGNVLTSSSLQPPQLIHKGDAVVIIARNRALAVRMSGTALEDGERGKQIRVRNNRSKRIIKAIVVDKGQVEVPL